MISPDIATLLEEEAAAINSPNFIGDDPVQFPRRFSDLRDIEIAAFLSAMIAWGNRKMICRDAEKILALMDYQPYRYVMEKGYEDLNPKLNIHRTMFGEHMQWFLRGMHEIYRKHDSLDSFAAIHRIGAAEAPAWELVRKMKEVILSVNDDRECVQCLPSNLDSTALKRINMALRWLVRDDGIVDMGVWKSIDKSKLFIPLDVHVGNTARDLGLLSRRSNDRRSVDLLTSQLRELDPADPVRFDYALFGIGIKGKQK